MNTFKLSFVASLIFSLCFFHTTIEAQTSDKGLFVKVQATGQDADLIQYSGHIAEGTNRDTLYLLTRSKRIVRIPFASITRLESERGEEIRIQEEELRKSHHEAIAERNSIEEREENTYVFRERGFYTTLGTEFNIRTGNNSEAHPGVDFCMGYKFNRMLAVGVGGSIRSWTWDVWPNAVGHVYGEARGWFLKKSASPFYRVRLGYGNAWGGGEGNYESSKGGLYFSPSIGIRLIGSKVMQLNLETGLNHQQMTYMDLDFGAFERRYKFNRHFVAISMMY